MSSDLVSVLNDGTLREYTEELTLMLARQYPEAQGAEWSDALMKEASAADESQDEADAAQKTRAVVEKLVKATPGIMDGTDRGMYLLLTAEVEGLFNLQMTLVVRYFDGEERSALLLHLVQSVGDANAPSAAERSVLKYRILANIFNVLPPAAPLRLDVFLALLSLASANGDVDFLQTALDALPTWLAQWDVPAEKKNACLNSVAAALQAPDCGPEWVTKAYQFSLLHLRYISNETSIASDQRRAEAEKIIADVLRLPKLFEMEEVLQVPVTAELDGQPIFALLKIFVAGTHEDLAQWASQNKAVLERLSLDFDALSRKMRLLDLATLCARSVSAEVSYADIAKVLDVSTEEVEAWVIDVIRAGLVSGKLSQVKQSFRVYRSTHRTFEKPQWESLETRLSQWQKSIQTLISTIGTAGAQNRVPSALADVSAPSADETPASEPAPAS
ncbi:hypothetical protein MOBT1_001724 [Malassezia obtusa]|uniref:Eukaryotic translation initiation factor 3 subunit M n=1 Tax=Malassezia obtusa TaxID=76774 RepID=A0AAF0IRW9_9BASI|nr:hypothetical protein MOBT1_001724 [Malassezia obtusa]